MAILRVFILLVTSLLFSMVAVNGRAQMSNAQKRVVDDYVNANLYSYYSDLTSADILDCLAYNTATSQLRAEDKTMSEVERAEYDAQTVVILKTWRSALGKSGIVLEQQIQDLLPKTQVANLLYGKDVFAVQQPEGFRDVVNMRAKICSEATQKAIDGVYDFIEDNYDIVFAPPADNPYLIDRGNESLRGLFRSMVEYPPANARITAQRCFMIPAYASTRVIGSLHGREAPGIDSLKFGYEQYEEFDSDIQAIYTHFRAVLETMPSDPMSNHEAIDQPRNETSSIIRTGTSIQEEMFSTAIVKAMPDCVSRARAGLSKGSGK